MKHISLLLSLGTLLLASLRANITVDFGGGQLYTNTGTPLPTGSLVLLVADTGHTGFGPLTPTNLDVASFFNGTDDFIVAQASVTDLGGFQGALSSFNGSFSGAWGQDDPLALFWFSPLTGASLSGGEHYGYYTSSSGADGSDAWITPSDGTPAIALSFLTISAGGTINADSLGYANFTVTAIPEPSAYAALAGALTLGLAFARRRRRG